MLDWLDAIPNLGVLGVPGVQPQKSASFHGTPGVLEGVPGVLEHLDGTPGTPCGTPHSSNNNLKNKEEHREHPEHLKTSNPVGVLRDWHDRLSGLDMAVPPAGVSAGWWARTVSDAHWIYENFASRAVRDGWSAHDLFGVLPSKPAWGGIVDRLRGARDLEITDCRAFWTHAGHPGQFNKGAAAMLLSSGLVLLWDM
ncbi:hypothetical protein U8326_10110 [Tsuneonella sp. CC-YZS046]|uniref:hypothetical protein n=1 Tax=Tsuneonella sp. CC-YZS046 TaxID=3042152 RepID=UPI002D7769EB|nr:hypothetical protein [Tsuneonella sp. CC-YZS046]WRO65414.1 hypothetical protein U8326_10110 [Tsuneonella sp. CC-YZS046]